MKRSSTIGLAIGTLYALVYLALAAGAAGAGHGTYIFFAPVAPYLVGLLLFPLAGFLAVDLRPFRSKVVLISALIVHYAVAIIFLRLRWADDFSYFEKVWNIAPWNILLPAGWYLLGQAIIWAVLIRCVILQAHRAS